LLFGLNIETLVLKSSSWISVHLHKKWSCALLFYSQPKSYYFFLTFKCHASPLR